MFNQKLEDLLANSPVTLFAFKWLATRQTGISRQFKGESLRSLDPIDVFERTLNSQNVSEEDRDDLLKMYNEILGQVQ